MPLDEDPKDTFRHIEVSAKPKKAGLHDSGFRYLHAVGITADKRRVDLGEWHDVIHFGMMDPTQINLDVTEDGTWRFFSFRGDLKVRDTWASSLEVTVAPRSNKGATDGQ